MFRIRLACLSLLLGTSLATAQDKNALTPIEPAKLTRTDPISYEKDIKPIFVKKCQVCHAGNLTEGKFDLSTYASMMKGGKRGAAIVAGKSEESFLYKTVAHLIKPVMPPKNEDDPLSPTEVALIKLWIDQGAKPPAIDTKTIRTVVVDLPPALVKPVRAVAFSTALNLVAAGRGNQIHLFDAKTGEFKKTLLDPDLKTVSGKPAQAAHLSLVEAMAFSPDGSTLISGSFREAVLWDVSKGTIVKRLTGFADRVVTIDFAQDGTLFATGGGAPTEDGEIKIFDKSGKVIKELTGIHSDTVFGLNFSPDGKLLATAGADKFVRVLSLPDGKVVKSFEGHTHHVMDVAWTADGKRIVSAGADNIVKVWDYEKGEKVRDINAAKKQVTRLVMVPKTSQFLTCDGDSDVKMWNADNGGSMRSFTGGKDFMYAVAVSTDGKFVATGGEEGIIRLYSSDAKLIKALYPPGEEPTVPKK